MFLTTQLCFSDESIESLKAKYDAQALDEEDDRAMGKETPQSAAMHVEVRLLCLFNQRLSH